MCVIVVALYMYYLRDDAEACFRLSFRVHSNANVLFQKSTRWSILYSIFCLDQIARDTFWPTFSYASSHIFILVFLTSGAT